MNLSVTRRDKESEARQAFPHRETNMSKLIGRRASLAVGAIAISAQFGVPSASAQSASSLEPRPRTGLSVAAPVRDWPPSAMLPTSPNNSVQAHPEKVAQLDGRCLWYIVTDTFFRDGRMDSLHTKTAQPCDQPAPKVSRAGMGEDKAADNSPSKMGEDSPGQGKPEDAQSGQDEHKVASERDSQPPPKVERRAAGVNPLLSAQSPRPTPHRLAPSRITALRRGTSHSKIFAYALRAPPEGAASAYSGEPPVAGLEGLAGMGFGGLAIFGGMHAHRFGGFGGFFRP
jgi:hypothetical protein